MVIGAGAIGLEMGSVWNRLGAKVTVVELLPRVAPFADAQMSTFLERSLKAQGMIFRLGAKVTGAKLEGEGLSVTIQNAKGEEESFTCDKILVAVGRKPCTDTAGLQEAGVILEGGRVAVDDHFRTNLPGVYAIGDLIRGPMLAHKAEDEGVALAELLAGKAGHVNYEAIPNVVYTHPELACVGLTEEECKAKDLPVKVGKFYFKGNGRAKSLGEDEGLVKVVAHAETDRLLGVHILGARASDMIAEAVVAMEMHASAEDLARTCHAHPDPERNSQGGGTQRGQARHPRVAGNASSRNAKGAREGPFRFANTQGPDLLHRLRDTGFHVLEVHGGCQIDGGAEVHEEGFRHGGDRARVLQVEEEIGGAFAVVGHEVGRFGLHLLHECHDGLGERAILDGLVSRVDGYRYSHHHAHEYAP